MSALMDNPKKPSQSDLMEQYMSFCRQNQNNSKIQQNMTPPGNDMFEQFMKQLQYQNNIPPMQQSNAQYQNNIPPMQQSNAQYQNNIPPMQQSNAQYQNNIPPMQQSNAQYQNNIPPMQQSNAQYQNNIPPMQYQNTPNRSVSELPLFDKFMQEQFKTQQPPTSSFIPFDIDNFNGDGLQKEFDLAYQNESQRMYDM